MRVIGGDVCRDSLVCWELIEKPGKLKDIFNQGKRKFTKNKDPLTFYANETGLALLEAYLLGEHDLALAKVKADCLVLEPTGIHYAKVWAIVAEYLSIDVRWVGHQEAVFTRRSERLPNKNDQADALALAAYTWLLCLHFPGFSMTAKDWDKLLFLLIYLFLLVEAGPKPYLPIFDSRQQSPESVMPINNNAIRNRLDNHLGRAVPRNLQILEATTDRLY